MRSRLPYALSRCLFVFIVANSLTAAPAPADPTPIRASAAASQTCASVSASAGRRVTRTAVNPRRADLAHRITAAHEAALSGKVPVTPAAPSVRPSPLAQRIGRDVTMVIRPGVGTPMQIVGDALAEASAAVGGEEAAVSTARAFLRANQSLLGLENADSEMSVAQCFSDDLGLVHVKFEQRWRGLAVWPGEATVHLDREGRVYLMSGAYVFTPKLKTASPIVSADDATKRARAAAPEAGLGASTRAPELLVYAPMTRAARLAWRVEVGRGTLHGAAIIIDAINGAVLDSIPLVMTKNVAGSGRDLSGTTVELNVVYDHFQHRHNSRSMAPAAT